MSAAILTISSKNLLLMVLARLVAMQDLRSRDCRAYGFPWTTQSMRAELLLFIAIVSRTELGTRGGEDLGYPVDR